LCAKETTFASRN
jgi:hypothetical protein